ncbi:MAG: hypothetical protein WC369_09965 [Dehalococcoidales bacterium]
MNKKRFSGLAFFLVGIIVSWVGYGMWRNPHLDWNGFKESGGEMVGWFASEAVRLADDPFAIIGIVVMVGGIIVLLKGAEKLITRKQ